MGTTMRDEALRRERQFWDRIIAKDLAGFSRLLHPNYVGVYRCGRHNVDEEVASTKDVNIESVTLEEPNVAIPSRGVVTLSYRLVARGQVDGEQFSVTNNAMTVWVGVGGAWTAAAHAEASVL